MEYIVTSRLICKKSEIISAAIDGNAIRIVMYTSNPVTLQYEDKEKAEEDFASIRKEFSNE